MKPSRTPPAPPRRSRGDQAARRPERWGREESLLLACARTDIGAGARDRVHRLAQKQIDWARFLDLCAKHMVYALVERSLTAAQSQHVPPHVMETLADWRMQSTAFDLKCIGELFWLLDALESCEVQPIAFKGPALAKFAYGDVALRNSVDVDLIVRRAELEVVRDALFARGYRYAYPTSPDDPGHKHHAYVNPEVGVAFEIHWRVSQIYDLDPLVDAALRDVLPTVELFGRDVPVLPTETLLIALIVHGTHDQWRRLKWLCDIAEILERHPNLDIDGVMETARWVGCAPAVALALSLASELLDADLPGDVSADGLLSSFDGKTVADRVVERMFREGTSGAGLVSTLAFSARMQDSARGKARAILYHLYTGLVERADRKRELTWRARTMNKVLTLARPIHGRLLRSLEP